MKDEERERNQAGRILPLVVEERTNVNGLFKLLLTYFVYLLTLKRNVRGGWGGGGVNSDLSSECAD
jgi:hypothetical protein